MKWFIHRVHGQYELDFLKDGEDHSEDLQINGETMTWVSNKHHKMLRTTGEIIAVFDEYLVAAGTLNQLKIIHQIMSR